MVSDKYHRNVFELRIDIFFLFCLFLLNLHRGICLKLDFLYKMYIYFMFNCWYFHYDAIKLY